jgi:hypothetical protein
MNEQTPTAAGPVVEPQPARTAIAPAVDIDAHELTVLTPHPLVAAPANDFSPRSLDEALRLCDYLANSDMVPKEYQGKPGNVLVAIQWGAEIGLKPLQSMQNISTINGRPSLWGDAQLALVRNSPHCEYVLEDWDEHGTARCRAKRRGEPEQVRTFSIEDQKTAGLHSKQGPHTQYPKRMRQLRARAFALRDVFTDVLRGIPQTEEVLMYQRIENSALPPNASGAQVAAAAAPKVERTDKHASQIADLELIARGQGFDAVVAAWGRLSKEDRIAIGIPERDRIGEIGKKADEGRAAKQQPELPA